MAEGGGNINGDGTNPDDGHNRENDDGSSPPDIGLGHHDPRECSCRAGCGGEGGSRDDNPVFSFKHFLSGNTGSRLKMYRGGFSSPPQMEMPHMTAGSSCGLPDFVQDHLVVEQSLFNSSNSSSQQPMSVDLEHLPDFPGVESYNRVGGGVVTGSNHQGVDTSLPDFLSDGPIRSERRDSDSPSPDLRHSPRQFQIENERIRLENERLRRELEAMRRQLSDQITRSETLEAELSIARSQDPPDTLKQTEDSLKRANKRVLIAENRAEKLKQEVQSLRNELEAMRCREGTASTSALQTDSERLASQLRNAANTAELSLRHLLMGVDNLRQLAASIESQQGRRSRPPRHDSSDESLDEDAPGPAL